MYLPSVQSDVIVEGFPLLGVVFKIFGRTNGILPFGADVNMACSANNAATATCYHFADVNCPGNASTVLTTPLGVLKVTFIFDLRVGRARAA